MSQIIFLGTGAADWEIENKGDFFRRNSSVLINHNLIVDCGPHIFDYRECFGDDVLYDNVTDVLITHAHSDHFSKASLLRLSQNQKLRVWGDGQIGREVSDCENVEFTALEPHKEVKFGDYTVLPLLANHHIVTNGDCCAFHYIIKTKDDKTIFYGLDGAWLLCSTWNEMKNHQFDAMIFDCTVGDGDDWRLFEHNTIPMLRKMTKEILERKMLKESGVFVASHLARTLHTSHEETEKLLKKSNILTAFDSMELLL